MNSIPETQPSRLDVAQDAGGITMRFSGRLDANGVFVGGMRIGRMENGTFVRERS